MDGEPIGLYIHIPFCRRRCNYCDFSTEVAPEQKWTVYVEAVVRELEHWESWFEGRQQLHSVYFGGGTPSLIGAERLGRMLQTVFDSFECPPKIEISLEANPETLTAEQLAALKRSGFNRLSIGVQSFQPLLLAKLGRCHSAEAVERAVRQARQAGFINLSLDLIYGIPEQDLQLWQADLERAVRLEPQHLSVYELSLEPWTPLGRLVESGRERLPEESAVVQMYEWAETFLPKMGYNQYEISNFARPGFECVHNLRTWLQGEYIGVGMAAHSHLNGRRFRNPKRLEPILTQGLISSPGEAAGYHELRWLSSEEKWAEALILGLRLNEGILPERLEQRLGSPMPKAMSEALERSIRQGWAERMEGRIRLTRSGRLLSDCLFADLVV